MSMYACVCFYIYPYTHTSLSVSLPLSSLSLSLSSVYVFECSLFSTGSLEVERQARLCRHSQESDCLRARRDILDDGSKCKVAEDLSFKFSKLEEVLSRALRSLVNIEKFVEVDFRLLLIQKEQKQWVSEP
jgi:hypothetical protein